MKEYKVTFLKEKENYVVTVRAKDIRNAVYLAILQTLDLPVEYVSCKVL